MYAQNVCAGLERALARHAPSAKHVVCVEQRKIVEPDICVSIEAVKHQLDLFSLEQCGCGVERGLVLPIRFSDPLQLLFVVAIERIVDQFVF